MHDNAPSHAAKATTQFLHSLGFVNETLMVWPPNSPDLNPIENLWSIIKLHVYANGKQYSSKDDLWMVIKESAATIPKSIIEKLTDSVKDRLFEVIKRHGAHVNKQTFSMICVATFANFINVYISKNLYLNL